MIKNDKLAPVVKDNAFSVDIPIRENGDKLFYEEEQSDYAFFSKEAFKMTFDITDSISGIDTEKLGYYFVDEKGEKLGEDSYDLEIGENPTREQITARITVPSAMKGYVRLFLEDNVGNKRVLKTKGIIVETREAHELSEMVSVTMNPEKEDTKKDANGLLLFEKDTYVSVNLFDTYAGIQSVRWSIRTEDNEKLVYEDQIFVDKMGNISANGHGVNWAVNPDEENHGVDKNLVTALKANIPVTVDSNNICVTVIMVDNVGNETTESYRLSVDKTAPVVSVSFDLNNPRQNNVYNATRTATVTIKERNFSDSLLNWDIVSKHGNVASIRFVQRVEADNPDDTQYIYEVVFEADDDYDFAVSCKDMAGHDSNKVTEATFTMDKTAPVVTVEASKTAVNEKYFAEERVITVTVTEHNFDPANMVFAGEKFERAQVLEWQSEGDIHVLTIAYREDDVYTLQISGVDMGGNAANTVEVEEFVIDKTLPEFTILGVTDRSANRGAVAPNITFTDTNFDVNKTSVKLVGDKRGEVLTGYWSEDQRRFVIPNIEEIQANDDIYTLEINAVDMAGNTKSETIRFSANRFGSTYSFDENTKANNGKYVRDLFDVVLTEINVDELDMESIRISVSFNGSTTELTENEHYIIEKGHVNNGWCTYSYHINKNVFGSDGAYTVRAYSVDAAGNKNDSTDASKKAEISFGVDRTKPIIKAMNLVDNGKYKGKSYEAKYQLTDNLSDELDYEVFVDGQEVEAIIEGDIITFAIPESDKKHVVEVKAVDAAGNNIIDEKTEILVSDNLFVRVLGSKEAATAAAAAATGATAAGGGTAATLAIRKRRLPRIKKK